MSSLTETAQATKMVVNVIAVLIVLSIVGTAGYKFIKDLTYKPPGPPPPSVGFGALPQLQFPKRDIPENLTFNLQTPDFNVPSFGDRANVYYISKTDITLLALDRAKSQAASLGFVFEPVEITKTKYRWIRPQPLQAILEMNIDKNEFAMKVSWESDPNFLKSNLLPNQNQAISEAKGFLRKAGFLYPDLETGEATTTLFKYSAGQFTEAVSLSNANFIQVDFFRAPIEKKYSETVTLKHPILPADPFKGIASIIISGSRDQGKRIISAEYKYTNVDYDQPHTYPIITGPQAWEMLQKGAGFIASPPAKGSQATIRRVELGYYDSLIENSYLQPIYVFRGDDDFIAYVPAVSSEWIGRNPSATPTSQ